MPHRCSSLPVRKLHPIESMRSGPSISLRLSEWRLGADSAVIVPPITLHVAPAGARSSGFVELVSGLNYRVDLFVFSPGRPADFVGNSRWVQP
jgi:hypothetical protein